MAKKMTMETFLKQKGLIENKKENYYSKLFDAEFEVTCSNPAGIVNIMGGNDDENRKYLKLIYDCCPFFKDEALRAEFDVKDPYDLVVKVFGNKYGEIYKLGNFILEKYGFLEDTKKEINAIKEQ